MTTIGHVEVRHPRLVQFALGRDVEHGSLFTVVDTRLFGVIALLVVSLNLAHEFGGQVLHSRFGIALEEVLTIDQELLHGLTIPLNRTIIAYFDAWQLLNERLQGRTCWHAVGRSWEHRCVVLLFYTWRCGRNRSCTQHFVVRHHWECAKVDRVLLGRKIYNACQRLKAHIREFDDITACVLCL